MQLRLTQWAIAFLILPFSALAQSPAMDLQNADQAESAKSERAKDASFIKHWYVGVGPVWSDALLGSSGTKFNVTFAYNQGLSEHWNLVYFYDGNFNTDTQGKSDIAVLGAGLDWFLSDRFTSTSPMIRLDAGYGGSNRNEDGGAALGAAFGVQFFRTKPFTFEAIFRYQTLMTSNTDNGVKSNPTVSQLRFGVYF